MTKPYCTEEVDGFLIKDGTIHYKYQYMDGFTVGCSLEGVPIEYREKLEFYSNKMKLWLQGFMMDIVKELEENDET